MNFEFILTIIFAVIALVIILKLRSVLGRRTGHEVPPERWGRGRQGPTEDNVVNLPPRERAEEEALDPDASPVERGIAEIKMADPRFQTLDFVDGAKMAFRMILEAFAEGDRETLRPLLAADLYESFDGAITEREKAGYTKETELVDLVSARITDAALDGDEARVTVTFEARERDAVRDADGNVVEGDPSEIITNTDVWTFARSVRSSDPNWQLVGTDVETGDGD